MIVGEEISVGELSQFRPKIIDFTGHIKIEEIILLGELNGINKNL